MGLWGFALPVGSIVRAQFVESDRSVSSCEQRSQSQGHNSATSHCICFDNEKHIINIRRADIVKNRNVYPDMTIREQF